MPQITNSGASRDSVKEQTSWRELLIDGELRACVEGAPHLAPGLCYSVGVPALSDTPSNFFKKTLLFFNVKSCNYNLKIFINQILYLGQWTSNFT